MASIINTLMGSTDVKMSDAMIANDTLSALKASSVAYLGATLESSTPEVRRMFSEFTTQCTLAHEGLTGLSVKRNWYQPYLTPDEQLTVTYQQAEMVLHPKTQS